MNKKSLFYGLLFSLLCSTFIFFLGYSFDRTTNGPKDLYQVYLEGKMVGLITNEQELYNLIDKEQENLKADYQVDKIYPPNSLEVAKVVTYNENITSAKNVYEKIKNIEPFTVKGYEVTIKKTDSEGKETNIVVNILEEGFLDAAIKSVIKTYVDEKTYNEYLEGLQEQNITEGSILEKVDLEEEVIIKEKYISTEEKIYKTEEDFIRYFLFGTDEISGTYTVKVGDTVKSIAAAHNLNVNEFLMVNSEIKGENALLFPGQVVSVGLIDPIVTIVLESTVIQNQQTPYETQVKFDNSLSYGTTVVQQEGSNGVTKYTFRTESKNGRTVNVVQTGSEILSEPTDEIILKGGFNVVYVGDSTYWAWPTLPGYVITSYYEWRTDPVTGERRFHAGVDISGTGHGSPIFAIQNGVVAETGWDGSMGNYVYIDHQNGYLSVYMHLSEIFVAAGESVTKGSTIGTMGNTGKSTGTHLHIGVFTGRVMDSNSIDPLTLYQ